MQWKNKKNCTQLFMHRSLSRLFFNADLKLQNSIFVCERTQVSVRWREWEVCLELFFKYTHLLQSNVFPLNNLKMYFFTQESCILNKVKLFLMKTLNALYALWCQNYQESSREALNLILCSQQLGERRQNQYDFYQQRVVYNCVL